MNIKRAVADLVKAHGSYRKAGAAVGVGYSYLFKLATGANKNPTVDTLRKIGLL